MLYYKLYTLQPCLLWFFVIVPELFDKNAWYVCIVWNTSRIKHNSSSAVKLFRCRLRYNLHNLIMVIQLSPWIKSYFMWVCVHTYTTWHNADSNDLRSGITVFFFVISHKDVKFVTKKHNDISEAKNRTTQLWQVTWPKKWPPNINITIFYFKRQFVVF